MPKNTEENSQKSIKRTNESSIDLESKEAKLAKKLKSLESRSLASVTIPYTNVPGNNKINSKQPLPSPTTTVDTEKVSVCQDQETSIETNNITTEKTTLMDTEAVMDHDTTTFISSTSTTKTKTIDNQQSIRTMVSQDQETSKETTDTVPTIDDKKPVSAMAARRAKKLELEARSTAATLDTTSTTASPPSPTPATTTTSTTDPSQPERPLSALAARRAKKVATDETSIPSSPVDDLPKSTITPDRVMNSLFRETETEAESDLEYLSAEADFDMDDDDDDDQKLEIMSTPPTISDSEYKDTNDKEDMTKIKEAKRLAKLEEKLANMLVDPYSVSTFDSENVVAFEHNGETCFCIGFKKNQNLVFLGYALIGTLFGSIQINGATISSSLDRPQSLDRPLDPWRNVSFFPVFSPKSAALMTVQSIAYERTMVTSPSTTFDSTFSDLGNILEPLRSSWNSFESVIIVKDLSWCGIEDLQKVLPSFKTIFKFDNATYRLNDGPFYEDMPGFNPIVKTTPAVKALKIQTSWDTAVNRLLENEQEHAMPSISMVCGTKNVGKSTFGRYLVNRLLNVHQRVAYLETDIGQTEFTPSGMVSFHILDTPLLGPPFSHPHLKCKRSFFVGSTSPKNDATYYLDCIQQLVQTYRQESEAWVAIAEQDGDNSQRQLLPLVVNIHGYVKGAGYDMLMTMMKDIMPTHVFAFVNSPGVSNNTFNLPPDFTNNVMMMQESLPNRHLIHLQIPTNPTSTTTISDQGQSLLPTRPQQWKAPPTTWADKYQPIDHRQFMLMSYMYHDAYSFYTQNESKRSWWHTSTRLVERIPWTIDWRTHLKGIWVLFDDVPVSQLLYALNGSLVGLIGQVASDEQDDDIMMVDQPSTVQESRKQQINNDVNSSNDQLDEVTSSATEQKNHTIPPKYHAALTSAPPNPATTTCYGVGLIRSIDPENHRFYILTPLSIERLQLVTGLVKGDLELPLNCMFDKRDEYGNGVCDSPWRQVPYLSLDVVETAGSAAPRLRRNIMRKSQQME